MSALSRLAVCTMLVCGSGGVALAGPVEDGIAAYGRGDFANAYRLLQGPAESGDVRAQFHMGGLAQAGHGRNAATWFERAIAQGHADSHVALGYLYLQGRERPKNVDEAFRLFKVGAERGSGQGLLNLSRHYEAGLFVPVDRVRAAELRRQAAAAGSAEAAQLIERGRASRAAIDDDTARWHRMYGRNEEAFAQRLRQAMAGDALAQSKVAIHYSLGLGVRKDLDAAVRWLRAAAAQGEVESLYNLGLHYYHGWGVAPDRAASLDWFRQAQAKGHPDAPKAVALLTAPPPRPSGSAGGVSDYEIYMNTRRSSCQVVGGTIDQYGTCR